MGFTGSGFLIGAVTLSPLAAEPSQAIELIESDPVLRDEPRHLLVSRLCPSWLMDPSVAVGYAERRINRAREASARPSRTGRTQIAPQVVLRVRFERREPPTSWLAPGSGFSPGTRLGSRSLHNTWSALIVAQELRTVRSRCCASAGCGLEPSWRGLLLSTRRASRDGDFGRLARQTGEHGRDGNREFGC